MSAVAAQATEIQVDVRRGFVFDVEKCTGCNACELACTIENELPWGTSWRQVTTVNPERLPGLPTYHLSLACNHCDAAPCMRACPARAIDREARTGTVAIDAARCIGCKYCSWACPYGAPLFDDRARVMTKCTGCNHRLVEGLEPACVASCPTTALAHGPLAGVESVPGFPETDARPAIRFHAMRPGRSAPESTWTLPAAFVRVPPSERTRRPDITLGGEWPLLVFTTLLPLLVGWTLAQALGGSMARSSSLPATGGGRVTLSVLVFCLGLGIAIAASLLHLGHKRRAWRAVLNLRGSWLSREVAGVGGFAIAGIASVFGLGPEALLYVTSGVGIWTLFAIDRVYDVVRPRPKPRLHSADTLVTGLFYAALLAAWGPGVLGLALLKLGLYVRHDMPRRARRSGQKRLTLPRHGLRGLRIAAVVGAGAVPFVAEAAIAPLFLLVLAGESIDRAQFYTQLEPVRP